MAELLMIEQSSSSALLKTVLFVLVLSWMGRSVPNLAKSNLDPLQFYFTYPICGFVSKLGGLKGQILHFLTLPVKFW